MDGGAWWAAVLGSLRVGHDWATSLSLSCIGEGNGNPLQCSCLENPRDRGAWRAAVYEVAQSRTRLKRLSSSSSSRLREREKMSDTCSLFPLFGNPWPSCLLPSHYPEQRGATWSWENLKIGRGVNWLRNHFKNLHQPGSDSEVSTLATELGMEIKLVIKDNNKGMVAA